MNATLILVIPPQQYRVKMRDGPVVELQSGGKKYTVTPGTCTCPAFHFGRGTACKHIAALGSVGLFSCMPQELPETDEGLEPEWPEPEEDPLS